VRALAASVTLDRQAVVASTTSATSALDAIASAESVAWATSATWAALT